MKENSRFERKKGNYRIARNALVLVLVVELLFLQPLSNLGGFLSAGVPVNKVAVAAQDDAYWASMPDTNPDHFTATANTDGDEEGIKTCTISKYSGNASKVKIPSTMTIGGEEHTVTKIGGNANYNTNNNGFLENELLLELYIPDTVTEIMSHAFYRCYNLYKLHLPSNLLAIRSSAFYLCGALGDVALPDSLESIGRSAFHSSSIVTGTRVYVGNDNINVESEGLRRFKYIFTNKGSALRSKSLSSFASSSSVFRYLVDSISVNSDEVKKEYYYNEVFSSANIEVTAKLSDGSSDKEFIAYDTCGVSILKDSTSSSPTSALKNVGTNTVQVDYGMNKNGEWVTDQFDINVYYNLSLGSATVTEAAYNGEEAEATYKVYHKNNASSNVELVKGRDYETTIAYNKETGEGLLTFTGKGNYKGTLTKAFSIERKDISKCTVESIPKQTYTGEEILPKVVVQDGTTTLVQDVDYSLSVSGGVMPGTATLTITGKGNYEGTQRVDFTIVGISVQSATVNGLKDATYQGKAIRPAISVLVDEVLLEEERDYTLTYSSNVSAGTASVLIKGVGIYTGSLTKSFKIAPASIATATVNGIQNVDFQDEEVFQNISVFLGEKELEANAEYRVEYSSNVNAGTATVLITGKGNYAGNLTKTFQINPLPIGSAFVANIPEANHTGEAILPDLLVTYQDKTLVRDKDYAATYSDNVNAGTATVLITGKGNYAGSLTQTFQINPLPIEGALVPDLANVKHTGKAILPNPSVTYQGKALVRDKDYTVTYSGNVNVGTATLTVTGVGNYKGVIVKTFNILPNKMTSATVKAVKGKVTVKWKKVKGAKGYEASLAKDKKFKKKKVKKNTTKVKHTFKKLKKGTYYVRVRAYTKLGGKKLYSSYSKVKKVKVK